MDLASCLAEYYELDSAAKKMNVTVHEDNSSALIFAKFIPPEHSPRPKFFHLETIWFREEIVKQFIPIPAMFCWLLFNDRLDDNIDIILEVIG